MNAVRYFLYFCGQLGMMGLARFFFVWILKYPGEPTGAVDADGVPITLFVASTVAWVFLGFRIFDGVTDPVAGVLSDWWVRIGKERRSLLLFACGIPPIGLAMVFWADASTAPVMRWVLLAGGMLVFFVGYTFYAIPYWSLMDDFSGGDAKQRRIMSNLLGAGMMGATLAGFVISGDLIANYGYRTAALWFSGPALLLMIMPYFAQPKGGVKSKPTSDEAPGLAAFKAAFSHRRFVRVLVIFSGSQMSFSVMSAAGPYIVEKLLGGDEADLKFVMGPFLLSALVCFGIVPYCSRKLGWERAVAYASLALGVVYVGTAFLGQGIVGSPTMTAGVLFGLGGPMAAVLLGLEGEAVTACAREAGGDLTAIYFGVFNLVVKAMNGVAVVLTGLLTDQALRGEIWAVRAMGLMAGCMLAVGVALYYLLKPKAGDGDATATQTASTSDESKEPEAKEPESKEPESPSS